MVLIKGSANKLDIDIFCQDINRVGKIADFGHK